MDYKQENKVEYTYFEDDEVSDTMYDEMYDNEYDDSAMEEDMCILSEDLDLCTDDLYDDIESKDNSFNQELQPISQSEQEVKQKQEPQLDKEPQLEQEHLLKQECQPLQEAQSIYENGSQCILQKTSNIDMKHLVKNLNYQYTSAEILEKEYFESLSQDNSMQMLCIGNKYLTKNESEQDLERAVNCYTSAAFLNNGFAQFNLAYCYYHGLGVPKNKELANLLLKRSLENVDGIIKPDSIKNIP